ncbi:hypothetical protein HPP92_014690 [Vanilla planifolia]|uniref:Uncharacterized protein n=1 Tax=Vanilla planifolia TaxID=51239 RepID=A0A835QQJ7_VANPL|nr:hypothetical protein HPP92_014690 [Vanilla planifolia]
MLKMVRFEHRFCGEVVDGHGLTSDEGNGGMDNSRGWFNKRFSVSLLWQQVWVEGLVSQVCKACGLLLGSKGHENEWWRGSNKSCKRRRLK